jgi:regulator of protease activity HflC (stomatin/prohibitin superfamily)
MIREAEAYRAQKITGSLAQSAQFTNQIVAYKASPEVFLQRSYLQTLSRGSSTNTPKFFLGSTNTDDVLILNLEEKVRRDILDLQVPKK